MKPNLLPAAFNNSGVRLEELLGAILTVPPQETIYGFVSALYRRLAAGALLMDGEPTRFFSYLCRGARAYLAFLEAAPPEERLTSKAAAFFDAVACHDEDAALRLTAAAPATMDPAREYEEDFFAVRVLMERFYGANDAALIAQWLDAWTALAADNPDTRLPVVRAIVAPDQAAFDDAIAEDIAGRQKRLGALRAKEQMDPDEANTTARVCVELLAWLDLAGRVGLSTAKDYPLAPSAARVFHRAALPAPDSWRVPEPFGAFDEE